MNTPLQFIPAAICLLMILLGLGCLAGVLFLRRAARRGETRSSHTGHAWNCLAKGLAGLGVISIIMGSIGLSAAGFCVGWMGDRPAQWSDGEAPELQALIQKRCEVFIKSGKAVGLSVAAFDGSQGAVMTFGFASLLPAAAVRPETLFEIGSITKTFTSLLLARQVEQGGMRMSEPIAELLPLETGLPEEVKKVTLQQLVTHTSGLPRLPGKIGPEIAIKVLLFGSDPYANYSEADLLGDLRKVKLEALPGAKFSYSNFGMTLMGSLLAAKAGVDFEAAVKSGVCRPLGMNDTTITVDRAQSARLAQGYRAVLRLGPLVFALRSQPWLDAPNLAGAGGLRSSAADMLKYLKANARPAGQELEHALRETHRELFKENSRMSVGMNWIRSEQKPFAQPLVWHNGGTGGFCSFLGFTEDGNLGVLVLSNTAEEVDGLAVELLAAMAARPR